MQHKYVAFLIGLAGLSIHEAPGQTPPVKPHLIMWPQSANVAGFVTPNPSSAIPIVRDDKNTGENHGTVYTAIQAATSAYNELRDADIGGWLDRGHLALFPRYVGADLFVVDPASNPAPQDPDFDSRTMRDSTAMGYCPWPSAWSFFHPNDRLVGLYDLADSNTPIGAPAFPGITEQEHSVDGDGNVLYAPGAGNRSFRHPFLVNATQQGPLRTYMMSYASSLRSLLNTSDRTHLQASGTTPCAQPTFIFDAEQAHIMQKPDKHSCLYMLWFLTQARVPGTTNQYIWDTFRVPGSEGWAPPQHSEIYENTHYSISSPDGFQFTTGETLAELFAAEIARQSPPTSRQTWDPATDADPTHIEERQYWPTTRENLSFMLKHYADSASVLPDSPGVRGIMLWWNEVCAKAEGAIWENAVFGPLHSEFESSNFINYTQMTTDGKVDTSSTVNDLGMLPTPSWPDYDGANTIPGDLTGGGAEVAPLIHDLPRALWSPTGANCVWKDGGPVVDGAQRRWDFFAQHIQGQDGEVAEHVMDSPDLYWRTYTERYFPPTPPNVTPESRLFRMDDPSLPSWAQLPQTITAEPARDGAGRLTSAWYRWNQHAIFQNLLEYRHDAESAINSEHITAIGTQYGQRQASFVPWIWQQLPETHEGQTPAEFEKAWLEEWSERIRSEMAMLRAKDGPHAEAEPAREWAVFISSTSEGYPSVWKRTEGQRDQVYVASVTGYSAATGEITTPPPESELEPDRLNDTLRRGTGETVAEYTLVNTGSEPVDDYSGQITRTDVHVTLFHYAWNTVCNPLNAIEDTSQPNELLYTSGFPQLGGAYEVYVETTASVTTGPLDEGHIPAISMMVEVHKWPTTLEPAGSWEVLPLNVFDNDGAAIFAAPLRASLDVNNALPEQAYCNTVRVRRKYIIREPITVGPNGDVELPQGGARYARPIDNTDLNEMELRIIQSCPEAGFLATSIDLVQVIPVCAHDLGGSRSIPVPQRVYDEDGSTATPNPTAAQDARYADRVGSHQWGYTAPELATHATIVPVGSMTETAYEDYVADVGDPGWAAPVDPRAQYVKESAEDRGPVFLNSAFCHVAPSETGAYEPATLLIQAPTWVRASSGTTIPVLVKLVDADPEHPTTEEGPYNYAVAMQIGIPQPGDSWRSAVITLNGICTALMTEGTYEVTPILTTGGMVQDADISPVEPAMDFAVRFTLLSDCNANGIPDYAECVHQITDATWLDVWPMDGLIDACYPNLCEPDYNGDSNVNQDDVDTLSDCVYGNCSGMAVHADPDFNHDGNIDQDDVTALINTVAGNGCP